MKWLITLGISILIGYGADWAPYYVHLFQNQDLTTLGAITQFEVPCDRPAKPNSYCAHRYRLPHQLFQDAPSETALGAGLLVSASTYSCAETPRSPFATFDDPKNPGRLVELLSRYQTVDLSAVACKGDLIIETWSRPSARRTGLIGGHAVIGTFAAVERVKRLTDFFNVDLLLLMSFVFASLYALSLMLSHLLGGKLHRNPFERHFFAWTGYVVIVSGVLQILIPVTAFPLLFSRLGAFFSLLAHATPALDAFNDSTQRRSSLKKFTLWLLRPKQALRGASVLAFGLGALMSLPGFVTLFAPLCLIFSVTTLTISLVLRNVQLGCFGVAFILSSLKALGFPYLPHPQISTLFVGAVLIDAILSRFRQGLGLTRIVFLARSVGRTHPQKRTIQDLLRMMFDQLGTGRLTLLILLPKGGCKILITRKENNSIIHEVITRDALPPVLAHVISTREALWHLHENSDQAKNIKTGYPRNERFNGHYLSAIPLLGERLPVGALAFTDYPDSWADNPERDLELNTIINLLQPLLIDRIHSDNLTYKDQWAEAVANLQNDLSQRPQFDPQSELPLQGLIKTTCQHLDAYGFLAKLDTSSRKFTIQGIHGYPSEVETRLRKGAIFALRENEQGPLALAANRQQIVIMSDVQIMKNVLHPNTNLFFKVSGTTSCAAIPIFCAEQDALGSTVNRTLWGILFLERQDATHRFTLLAEQGLLRAADAIGGLLDNLQEQKTLKQTREALSTFIPQELLQNVINGTIKEIKQQGFILTIDLKSSSQLGSLIESHPELQSQPWLTRVESLKSALETLAKTFHLRLDGFIWDAFHFTSNTPTPDAKDLDQIIHFFKASAPLIENWYRDNFKILDPQFTDPEQMKARGCLSYGDNSVGFSQGATRSWTLTGTEIAANTKLEHTCKGLTGVFFADDSLAAVMDSFSWENTETLVPSTQRQVFRLRMTWKQFVTSAPTTYIARISA